MERIEITIHPAASEEALLSVSDAMEQIVDLLRLHRMAQSAVGMPEEPFEWQLESASTNSPFTVRARATSRGDRDVSTYVRTVTHEMSGALKRLVEHGEAAWWMEPESLALAKRVLERNANGIGRTDFKAGDKDSLSINQSEAKVGLRAIAAVDSFTVEASASETEAWGEVIGAMQTVGSYYRRPALRMFNRQYGSVWCTVTQEIIDRFGHDKTLEDVWKGKTIGVEGRLVFAASGKLLRIISSNVREIPDAPTVDIEDLYDPLFTGGLDPVEYLRQFHEGALA